MGGTKSTPLRRPYDHLQYILKQLAEHNIPIEQIVRALEPDYSAEEVKAYLVGNKTKNAVALAMEIPEVIEDIVDARHSERSQIEGRREWYTAPRHPGIPRRECVVLKLSRERFLELCRLSQPELVDALGEETAEASAEAGSGEEDDEQETMNESTTRTFTDCIIEAKEFSRIKIPSKRIIVVPWLTEQSITLVSGWRGVGKTGFAMGLVEAITRGEPFGPWEVREPIPCLYLEGEMPVQDIQERLRQHQRYNSGRKCPLYVYSDAYASHLGMPRAHLANPDWRMEMKRILLDLGVKLWVVDNLASLTAGIDENSKKDWDPINSWLLELRFAGIATDMLHHTGKGGAQRGTSAREDNVDVSIMLKRPSNYKPLDGARFVVKFEKSRVRTRDLPSLADVEFQLTEDEQGRGVWTWKRTKGKTKKVKVLKMLDEGLNYDAINEETGLSKSRITQIKQEGQEKGWLDKNGKLTPEGLKFVYGDGDG